MAVIKPRDDQGKIITNIGSNQLAANVKKYLLAEDYHNWDCWKCEHVYDLEPVPGEQLQQCPHCGADPVPF